MKKKAILQTSLGALLLVLFLVFTLTLFKVDVQPIGPEGSSVAYAGINEAVHNFFGVNWTLYDITDLAGIAAIGVALGFAVLGLYQLIKRKNLWKVDSSILVLAVYYVVVFAAYVLFEIVEVNHRPVLVEGVLEASYPSSTTMLALCILPTAMIELNRLIKNKKIKLPVLIFCGLFTAFMVIGRLLSGVHWFTDILGGLLFSASMVLLFCAANTWIAYKKESINASKTA